MPKFEPRSFIYNIDVLSGSPGIFISGYKNYSTFTGLIATILIIFAIVFYTGYSLFFFFYEREMTIVELRDNFMTKNVSVSLNNFLFAFNVFNVSMEMEYYWGKEINLNSANDVTKKALDNNYTIVISYINPENEEIINKYYIEAEYCEVGKNIDQDIIDKYNFTNYKKFLCLNRDSNLDILINQTHSVYIDIIVSLKIQNENVFEYKEVYFDDEVYLSNYSYLEFEIYTPNDIISNKNQSHPIKHRKNYYNYELLTVGGMERYDMAAKYVDYSSDKGMIFQNKKEFNGIVIDTVTKKSLNLSSIEMAKELLYYQFRYYLNPNSIESYERTYKKLPTLLADVTTIISIFLTGGRFIISFVCKIYIETQTVFKILRFDKDISSKIELKKKSTRIFSIDCSKSSERQMIGENSKKRLSAFSINQPKEIGLSNFLKKKKKLRKKNKRKNNIEIINGNIYPLNDNSEKDKSNKNNLINTKQTKELKLSNEILYDHPENKNDEKKSKNENENKHNDKKDIKSDSKIVLNLFSFRDYFMFHFTKNKNNKTKLIDKLSTLLENSLSIEEIFRRAIDLQKVNLFIKSKYEEEFNSFNIMKVISNFDKEFIDILENEGKVINSFWI